MKVVLKIKIYSENKKSIVFFKEYISDTVPHVGEKIKDSIFAELKEITEVIYDYQNKVVTVVLKSKEVKDSAMEGHIQEVAELHDWKII